MRLRLEKWDGYIRDGLVAGGIHAAKMYSGKEGNLVASEEYFDSVAGAWDVIRAGYYGEELLDAFLNEIQPEGSMVVADIGAGTGFVSLAISPRVEKVFSVDQSSKMLEVLQQKASTAGITNIEFVKGDLYSVPLPSGSVDVVCANMVLHHCEEPPAALMEMVRILRSGGKLVIADLDRHPYEWMRQEMADVWLGFERSEVVRWLQACGLEQISVNCVGLNCCARSERCGEGASISIFMATATRP